MDRRRLALFVRGGAVSLALVACQVVAGIDYVDKAQRASTEAGTGDGGGGPDVAAGDPCRHELPPPPPENDDDRDTELPPIYLAVRTVDVVGKVGSTYRGFDLDGVCTCDERPGTFASGGPSCTPKLRQCDLDGGIDNKAASLFEKFAPTGFSPSDAANEGIAAGKRGLLLYIRGYNGRRNDRQVNVGVMISYGILDGSGCGTSTGQDRSPPGWCGNDLWTYPVAYVKPTTKEPLFQGNGYVNDGVLVFRSDEQTSIFFGGSALTFGSPVTAARIDKNEQGLWVLSDGLLSGRIPVTELLAATGTFGDPTGGSGGLCNSPFFTAVKKELCEAVDINRSNAFDFKEGACDGISSALSFTAEQAAVGEERTEPDEPNPCSRDQVSPDLYTCP